MNVVGEWVEALACDRRPTFAAVKDSNFLSQAQSRMQHLLKVEVPGEGDGAAPKTLTGEAAMAHHIRDMIARVAAGASVGLTDLQVFDTFFWLMSRAQADTHAAWVKTAFAKASGAATTSVAPRTTTPEAEPQGAVSAKKKKAAQDLADTTMSLFKRKKVS